MIIWRKKLFFGDLFYCHFYEKPTQSFDVWKLIEWALRVTATGDVGILHKYLGKLFMVVQNWFNMATCLRTKMADLLIQISCQVLFGCNCEISAKVGRYQNLENV